MLKLARPAKPKEQEVCFKTSQCIGNCLFIMKNFFLILIASVCLSTILTSASVVQGSIFDNTEQVCAYVSYNPCYFVFYNSGKFEAKLHGKMNYGTYSYSGNRLTLYWNGNEKDFTNLTITTNYGRLVNLEYSSVLFTKDKCN